MGNLFDSFEYSGEWWAPSNPDLRFRGKLSVEPGLYMTLDFNEVGATFAEFVPLPQNRAWQTFGDDLNQDIIVGITDDRLHVVLLNCVGKRFFALRYVPTILLISREEMPFTSSKDALFSSVHTTYTYLDEWLANFPLEKGYSNEKGRPTQLFARYTQPEPIVADVDSIESQIQFRFSISETTDWHKQLIWTQAAKAVIVPKVRQPIEWFIEKSHHLRRLLSILIGESVDTLSMSAKQSEDAPDYFGDVDIYYNLRPTTPGKKILSQEMFLSASDLSEELSSVFSLWFDHEKQEAIELLQQLFILVRYNPETPIQMRFLTLVQALETYHRRKWGDAGKYLSANEYDLYLQEIIEFVRNMPAKIDTCGHQEGLKQLKERLIGQNRDKGHTGYLDHGNEYSLNRRLKDLWRESSREVQDQLDMKDDEFLRKTTSTRNYFTHYERDERIPIFEEHELPGACNRLAQFITALILKELGLSDASILEALRRRKHRPAL